MLPVHRDDRVRCSGQHCPAIHVANLKILEHDSVSFGSIEDVCIFRPEADLDSSVGVGHHSNVAFLPGLAVVAVDERDRTDLEYRGDQVDDGVHVYASYVLDGDRLAL